LKFSIVKPQYYRYLYSAVNAVDGEDRFSTAAESDLDVDNITSKFNILGETQSGEVTLTPIFLSDLDNDLE